MEFYGTLFRFLILQCAFFFVNEHVFLKTSSYQWDTFRTLYPLYSLHDPQTFSRIVRGQINIQQHEGIDVS